MRLQKERNKKLLEENVKTKRINEKYLHEIKEERKRVEESLETRKNKQDQEKLRYLVSQEEKRMKLL
jgi:hypothetical protein